MDNNNVVSLAERKNASLNASIADMQRRYERFLASTSINDLQRQYERFLALHQHPNANDTTLRPLWLPTLPE